MSLFMKIYLVISWFATAFVALFMFVPIFDIWLLGDVMFICYLVFLVTAPVMLIYALIRKLISR